MNSDTFQGIGKKQAERGKHPLSLFFDILIPSPAGFTTKKVYPARDREACRRLRGKGRAQRLSPIGAGGEGALAFFRHEPGDSFPGEPGEDEDELAGALPSPLPFALSELLSELEFQPLHKQNGCTSIGLQKRFLLP
jgi:hypothetical protein